MKRSSAGAGIGNVLKTAGAYIAWVIGSGFATGQEVLQFFSAYGYMSFAVAGINLAGFVLFGYWLMRAGYENKDVPGFNHFRFFCGQKPGAVYSWLVTATLLLMITVMISGGGETLREYYGIPKPIGSAVFAAAVLAVYLIGFEKMVGIISKIGPVIILFSLLVGVISLFRGGGWEKIPAFDGLFASRRSAPTWWLSGLLYLGLNFFPGSAYFTRIGSTAKSKKELTAGAICGGLLLVLSIAVMSTAILLHGDTVAQLDIPTLSLARDISAVLGTAFSVILVLGIFSSCSAMVWTVCSYLSVKIHRNALIAVGVILFGYVVSLFSFGTLVSTVYPLIGYVGLVFLACVAWKSIRKKRPAAKQDSQ